MAACVAGSAAMSDVTLILDRVQQRKPMRISEGFARETTH
jgi:hypothetical protein